ncbi:hypothetical protein V8C35DRAFT_315387 [Trichoderma chlorosporum]
MERRWLRLDAVAHVSHLAESRLNNLPCALHRIFRRPTIRRVPCLCTSYSVTGPICIFNLAYTMPPQGPEALQQDKSSVKHKKKPVRRNAEKRRLQNIQAQKKYREKQRQHLEALEAIAASAGQSHVVEGQHLSTSLSEVATHNQNSNSSSVSTRSPLHQRPPRERRPPTSQPEGISSSQNACDSHSTSSASAAVPEGTQNPPSSSGIVNDSSIASPPASTPGQWHLMTPPSDTTHSHPHSPTWDSSTHVSSSFLIGDKARQGSSLYWTTTINCGCLKPHVQLRSRDPSSHDDMQIVSFSANSTAADPYAGNRFCIERVCIAGALYTLMKYVGIGEENFCADSSPSPFYRPNLEFADEATWSRINTVQQTYKTLKPDLRPTPEQIVMEHHPYIDILPFPTLRRNLILYQKEIDEDEFLNDILTGLVCWGGAGTAEKDPDDATGHAAAGSVWDVRSWEAKVWFLKKYWQLLGGEDGELVRQSEWWRSVRGEETRIDLDGSAS